jgi:hypothetical protein
VSSGCNCQRTFDHAADHHQQIMRASYVNHL